MRLLGLGASIRGADHPLKYVLLAREDGSPVNDAVLEMVAELIEMTLRLARIGDLFILRTDPATCRRQ